ncbi:MAG TPA: lysylphosphatidylglycerol synthase transmembrane domain-containing protein [Vicinamibacterales bacterium]|nr:lysylphosphatidylglycerol synthase transmembrane domain-containing protein [Vicinamibacterales bacterium]
MPDEPNSSPWRRLAMLALKIAVSVALLALLFSRVDARRLWTIARHASIVWLATALVVYFLNVLASVWRWRLLLHAQGVRMSARTLLGSFLVASFFNNFLPSNIGGDVIRVRDTARPARSTTLATMVILSDRVLGLMALFLVASLGASIASEVPAHALSPIWPSWLWAGFVFCTVAAAPAVLAPVGFSRLLQPLTVFHPEWVGDRIDKLTDVLSRFRERPGAMAACFVVAVAVQASMIIYYLAVVWALHLPVGVWDLAVIVPISFVVQLLPVSVGGFGVREATFSLYFAKIGLPIESAVVMSLVGAALLMLFSLSGAAVWFARGHH